MLVPMIRILGVLIAFQSLAFTPQVGVLFWEMGREMPPDWVMLPPLAASLLLGLAVIVLAPRIAGKWSGKVVVDSAALLSAGLILLGIYWLGAGLFSFLVRLGMILRELVPSLQNLSSAIAEFVQVVMGGTLIVIGGRMRVAEAVRQRQRDEQIIHREASKG